MAILGHNGSGKSTLKHMNAILKVAVRRNHVGKRKRYERSGDLWDVRQSAGMVFQNPDNQIIGTVKKTSDSDRRILACRRTRSEAGGRKPERCRMLEYRKSSPNKLSETETASCHCGRDR